MRVRNTGLIFLVTFLAVVSASAIFAQQRRNRPAPAAAAPPQADLTIKFRSTTSGQSYESSTMIKGKRERSEMSMGQNNMTTITQCDLKRTIQISDSSRKYFITPMETGSAAATSV